eukprot:EG_transcript_9581
MPRQPLFLLLLWLTLACDVRSTLPDLDELDDAPSAIQAPSEGRPTTPAVPTPGPAKQQANAPRDHVPADFEFDDEEFEGLPPPPGPEHTTTPPSQKRAPPEPSVLTTLSDVLRRRPATQQEHFYYEAICTAYLVLYGATWYFGRRANEALARRWVQQTRALFQEQFSRVGTGQEKDRSGVAEPLLVKDSASDFEFYATGRVHCQSCLVSLALRQRQDVTCRLTELVFPKSDRMILEVAMNDDCLEPLCFVVARDTETLEDIRKGHLDVSTCSSSLTDGRIHGLPAGFQVLTDSPELAARGPRSLIPDVVVNTVGQSSAYFHSMHISDLLCTEDLQLAALVGSAHTGAERTAPDPQYGRKALRFVFALPPEQETDHLLALLQMAFHMIDHVATVKLSSTTKQKNMLQRAQVQGQPTPNPSATDNKPQRGDKRQPEERPGDGTRRRKR